ELWGFKKDPLMALVGAAVVARLPHPRAARPPAALDSGEKPVDTVKEPSAGDHDALLRRLRELGELHQAGILTADEFTTAKQALLRHL
ncbi:Tat pathway signal sequence domain protein, partial [Streptomyces sp. AcH 505]|uniref:SHOCT domain-containing protein n=1 Tax=Streptomyces sp. AcH 505 TaxID=352211 RepID=UPI00059220D3